MAKIGLQYPAFATLETVPVTGVLGEAITANIAITVSDVKLYGDDAVAESDRGFQTGTIDLTTTELSIDHLGALLGHEVTTGELVAKADDIPPYCKIGFIGRKRVDNVDSFRAVVLQKVQFGEPADENSTKGETMAFGTPTIQGTILTDAQGVWKKEKSFPTLAEAETYVDTEVGITTP